jgi:hypothetical protein
MELAPLLQPHQLGAPFRLTVADQNPVPTMSDEDIIAQRVMGRSVRAIAKAQGTTAVAVNEVIDCWAASMVNVEIRNQTLVLELTRLDDHRASGCDVGLACAADGGLEDCRGLGAEGNVDRSDRARAQCLAARRPKERSDHALIAGKAHHGLGESAGGLF